MVRTARVSEQDPPHERTPGPAARPKAARVPAEHKPPHQLWGDGLGRVGIRSAQILLILTVAVVSVYALMQIKLLVIPVIIALILSAAIGPFVNMLRRRGVPGGLATAIAFIGLLLLLGGVFTVIYISVRSQWGELAAQASSGLDELQQFLLTGPIPLEQEQLDQAREGIIQFATSSQARSGAITGLSVVTEFLAGAGLMATSAAPRSWHWWIPWPSGRRCSSCRCHWRFRWPLWCSSARSSRWWALRWRASWPP